MSFEDLTDSLLNVAQDTFGDREKILFVPLVGAPFELPGIFENQYESIDPVTLASIQTLAPRVGVKEITVFDVIARLPTNKDKITRQKTSKTYKIRTVEPDGRGDIQLTLDLEP